MLASLPRAREVVPEWRNRGVVDDRRCARRVRVRRVCLVGDFMQNREVRAAEVEAPRRLQRECPLPDEGGVPVLRPWPQSVPTIFEAEADLVVRKPEALFNGRVRDVVEVDVATVPVAGRPPGPGRSGRLRRRRQCHRALYCRACYLDGVVVSLRRPLHQPAGKPSDQVYIAGITAPAQQQMCELDGEVRQ